MYVRRRVRRKDWERIQNRILPSPRAVRRELYRRTSRRRRLRPDSAYIDCIYISAQLDIYTTCIIQYRHTHANIFAQMYDHVTRPIFRREISIFSICDLKSFFKKQRSRFRFQYRLERSSNCHVATHKSSTEQKYFSSKKITRN